jgi:hypothetical protein
MPSRKPSLSTQPPPADQQDNADYNRRAQHQYQQYTAAYKDWVASLTPEEHAKAVSMGLAEPLQDSPRVSGHAPGEDRDAAESPLAKTNFNFSAFDQDTPRETGANPWHDPFTSLTLQRVIGGIISSDNALIAVTALAFALNLDALNGLGSIREAAKKFGVSPEAISKKKRQWEKDLEIPPNAFAKSQAAKLALSIAQQTKHWKNALWKAPAKPLS